VLVCVMVNDMEDSMNKKRHGGPYDRGSADKYYGRPYSPHYFEGDTYFSKMVDAKNMTDEQLNLYKQGWDEEGDTKDWGNTCEQAAEDCEKEDESELDANFNGGFYD